MRGAGDQSGGDACAVEEREQNSFPRLTCNLAASPNHLIVTSRRAMISRSASQERRRRSVGNQLPGSCILNSRWAYHARQ